MSIDTTSADTTSTAAPAAVRPRTLVMVMPYRAFVEKAHEEGFRVHALWDRKVALGNYHDATDEYLEVMGRTAESLVMTDFTDPIAFEAALEDAVRRVQPDAIYHIGAEESMLATYRMAERWGLAVNPASAVEAVNDKRVMRELLAAAGLSPVRYAVAPDPAALEEVLAHVELPVVVKPTALSGSRGVLLIRQPAELAACRELLDRYDYHGPVLVEEYLEGPEFSVETVTVDGEHQVIGVTRKLLGAPPVFVEMGHVHPAPPGPEVAQIAEVTTRMLTAAGYRSGPAHTEVILTARGPRIVESQARLGGDRIPRLIQLSSGIDIERAIFQALAGRRVPAPTVPQRVAAITYFDLPVGRVEAVRDEQVQAVRELPFVDEFSFPFSTGSQVPRTVDWRTRHGMAIVVADTRDELAERIAQVHSMIRDAVTITVDENAHPEGIGDRS